MIALVAVDVGDAEQAGQDRDPVGARDELERADHRVHLDHVGDLDAVGLQIDLDVAAAHVGAAGHDDLERPAILEPHRLERLEAPLGIRQQHLAVAHDQPRFQSDAALEGRHHREIEVVGQHHVGEQAAVALDDVQPHVGIARRELFERRARAPRASWSASARCADRRRPCRGESAHLLVGAFEPADRIDAALVVALARRRRRDAGGRALEQPHARARARPRRRAGKCRIAWRSRALRRG